MAKTPDAFRTISEVADDLDLPQHVLRFWETRFSQIKPLKRGGGRRYYRPEDVNLLRGIRHLLYGEGYTIKGVQKIIKEQGIRHVSSVWRSDAGDDTSENIPEPANPASSSNPSSPQAAVPLTPPPSASVPVSPESITANNAEIVANQTHPGAASEFVHNNVQAAQAGFPTPEQSSVPAPPGENGPMVPHASVTASTENEGRVHAGYPNGESLNSSAPIAAAPAHSQTFSAPTHDPAPAVAHTVSQPSVKPQSADPASVQPHMPVAPVVVHVHSNQTPVQTPPFAMLQSVPDHLVDAIRTERPALSTKPVKEPLATHAPVIESVALSANAPKETPTRSVGVIGESVERLPADVLPETVPASEKTGFARSFFNRLPFSSLEEESSAGKNADLSQDDVKHLQATLFELLECKRLLDQIR